MDKSRLDSFLYKNEYFPSREKAKNAIRNGRVFVNDLIAKKAGLLIRKDAKIEIKGIDMIYVGRGGLKLEGAIKYFKIDMKDKICLDIGASTGGFTHCMLLNGAKKVYAVDVGHSQLSEILLNDERVINIEKLNFRYATKDLFPDNIEFATCDVSFISLDKILKPAYDILLNKSEIIALIKPQFEVGKDLVKKGIVKNPILHKKAIEKVSVFSESLGFKILDVIESPVKGSQGNTEFLIHLMKS